MRSTAELRGPKNPFKINSEGSVEFVSSDLEKLLRDKGYMVRDNRADIKPQLVTHIPKPSTFEPN